MEALTQHHSLGSGRPAPITLKHRWVPGSLILLVMLLLFTASCSEKVKPGTFELKRHEVVGVQVLEIAPSTIDEQYEASGTLKARTTSVIASKVMAQ